MHQIRDGQKQGGQQGDSIVVKLVAMLGSTLLRGVRVLGMAGRSRSMAGGSPRASFRHRSQCPSPPPAHTLSTSVKGSQAPWLLRGSAGGWNSMQELDGKLAELACARHAMSMNVRINDMLSRDDISFLGTESSHEFRRIAAMTAIKSFECASFPGAVVVF
eukprot:765610-Hanusia_phi.AAC.3